MSQNRRKLYVLSSLSLFIILAVTAIVIFIANKPLTEKQILSLFDGEYKVVDRLYGYDFPMYDELYNPMPYSRVIIDENIFALGEDIGTYWYTSDRFDTEYFTISPVYYNAVSIDEKNLNLYAHLTKGLIPYVDSLKTKKNVFGLLVEFRDIDYSKLDNPTSFYMLFYIDGDYYFADDGFMHNLNKISDKANLEPIKPTSPNPISPFIGDYELSRLIDFVPDPLSEHAIDYIYGSHMRINSNGFIFEDTVTRHPTSLTAENMGMHLAISDAKYDVAPLTVNSTLQNKFDYPKNILEYFSIDEPLDESYSFVITVTNEGLKEPVYIYVINGHYYMHNESLKFEFVKKS